MGLEQLTYPLGRSPANSEGVIEWESRDPAGSIYGLGSDPAAYGATPIIDDDQAREYSNGGNTVPVTLGGNPDWQPGGQGTVSSADRNATQRLPRYRSWLNFAFQEWSREPSSSGLHQNIGSRQFVIDENAPRQLAYTEQLRTARNRPEAAWDSGYVIGETGSTYDAPIGIGGV